MRFFEDLSNKENFPTLGVSLNSTRCGGGHLLERSIIAVFCLIDDRCKNLMRLRACRPSCTLFDSEVLTIGVVVLGRDEVTKRFKTQGNSEFA